MAKIHWLVYVIVGLFVSVSSWKLNYQKLALFFYIGLIFIFVGIAKLIFNLMKNEAGKKEKQAPAHHNAQHKLHHQAQQFKYCSNCRNVLRIHDRFCSRCGARA